MLPLNRSPAPGAFGRLHRSQRPLSKASDLGGGFINREKFSAVAANSSNPASRGISVSNPLILVSNLSTAAYMGV